jgi:hypothetical protein
MDDRNQGGLTGATGDLTPDGSDEEFIPAETREMSDPEAAHHVTLVAHARAEARRAELPDQPGRFVPRGAGTPPNQRDGGYGSEHGLAADDPAYREEALGTLPTGGDAPERDHTRLGGDELHDAEEEHF